jgi:soluble lytic murein transglycosylase-like protein
VKEQRAAPAVVPSIVESFRRLCRSSRPLCCGALAFSLVAPHLADSPLAPHKDLSGTVSLADSATAIPVAELETIDLLAEEKAAFDVPSSPYGQLIYDVAVSHSVSPQLVAAMIRVESSFNPRAVSRKGACGLMQLLPATARRFGVRKKKDLFDPQKNLEAGVRYVKWLTQRFGGDVEKILAAYNAGEGAVERFGGIPPYRETQRYVEKVFGILRFTAESGLRSAAGGVVAAGK